MVYSSATKKKEIFPFATKNLKGIMLSEISHIEKDKYCIFSFTCGLYKVKQTNEHNTRETD